jgi:hypothetical protein
MKPTSRRTRATALVGLWLGLVLGWLQPGYGGALVMRSPGESEAETAPTTSTAPRVPIFESVPGPAIPLPQSGGALINGAQGGKVTVGRFTVDVPPGAFKGTATILIAVPDARRLQCTLDIMPVLESFDLPVKLTVDASGGDVADANDWVLVTWDEKTKSWQKLPGAIGSAATMEVTGWLPHFSQWGVVDSKAGW